MVVAEDSQRTVLVKAKYTFQGTNNDELNFSKSDTIVVTQRPDGGWWEGTLNGVTGWFPSNYVTELKGQLDAPSRKLSSSDDKKAQERTLFRTYVVNDLLSSEQEHVDEMRLLFKDYLGVIKHSEILTPKETERVTGNLDDVLNAHVSLLQAVEAQVESKEQRIGHEFIRLAPGFKSLFRDYCVNHPYSVLVLTKHKDDIAVLLESEGKGTFPELIQSLSKPLRRVARYPNLLQELERTMDESDPDRGDTQRAAEVFRDVLEYCTEVRKKKESQLELIALGIESWPYAQRLEELGETELLTDGQEVCLDGSEPADRTFVLFTNDLLVLSIGATMDRYIFEKRLPLPGASVRQVDLPSAAHCLEVIPGQGSRATTGQRSPVIMAFPTSGDVNQWLEAFQSHSDVIVDDKVLSPREQRYNTDTLEGKLSPAVHPEVSTLPSPGHAELKKSSTLPPGLSLSTTGPPPRLPRHSSGGSKTGSSIFSGGDLLSDPAFQGLPQVGPGGKVRLWSGYCLRPYPPIRGNFGDRKRTSGHGVKMRQKGGQTVLSPEEYEDAQILKVIEAYCASGGGASSRQTVIGQAVHGETGPQVLLAEEEKLIIEEDLGEGTIVRERTLVDTVYDLKDQVDSLRVEVGNLSRQLEKEQKARRKLESSFKRSSGKGSTGGKS